MKILGQTHILHYKSILTYILGYYVLTSSTIVAKMSFFELNIIFLAVVYYTCHEKMCNTLAQGFFVKFIGIVSLLLTPESHNVILSTSIDDR